MLQQGLADGRAVKAWRSGAARVAEGVAARVAQLCPHVTFRSELSWENQRLFEVRFAATDGFQGFFNTFSECSLLHKL